MARFITQGETRDQFRKIFFDLRSGSDGITPINTEAGSQPEISIDGAAWSSTGIGTLNLIGNGRYYSLLSSSILQVPGSVIQGRYKSSNTAESPSEDIVIIGENNELFVGSTVKGGSYTDTSTTGRTPKTIHIDSNGNKIGVR
jgi:hypothetical protein